MQLLANRPPNFTGILCTNANGMRLQQRDNKGDLIYRGGAVLSCFFERFLRIMRRINPEAPNRKNNDRPIGMKKACRILDMIEDGPDDVGVGEIKDNGEEQEKEDDKENEDNLISNDKGGKSSVRLRAGATRYRGAVIDHNLITCKRKLDGTTKGINMQRVKDG